MQDSSARSYIAELRAQGIPERVIAERLMAAGWEKELVEGLLASPPASFLSALSLKGASPRTLTLLAALCLAAVGIVALSASIYWSQNPAVYAITLSSGETPTTPLTYGSWPALANRDFYESVKRQLAENKASFIVADLSAMELTLYQGGAESLKVPILAKGKEGSWWETPVGLYAVESREENHFSSFGEVYQPWSLGFQGNFFIHGWPYYEGGEPVASTYSGGCIRLGSDDARALYELSEVGMPVLVYNTPPNTTSFQYRFKTPDIEATAFAVADLQDGTVLAGENVSVQLPIASVTKLMSALVAVEYLNLERTVLVSKEHLVYTSVPRLRAGGAYTVHDLLVLMLTESSNEAAEAVAAALGRDYFIELMNKKAQAIGMKRTSFIDPTGLGVGNNSTTEDMFTLAKYLYESRRFILNITNDSLENDAYGEVVFKNIQNFNDVPGVENAFLGGKIGQTAAARETYLGVFGLTVEEEERPVVVVVLGARDSQQSVAKLLAYLNDFYDLNPKPD